MKNIGILIILLVCTSCVQEFLDIPDKADTVIPSSIEDFQRILDNTEATFNGRQCYIMNLLGGDEYYISDQVYNSISLSAPHVIEKQAYTWENDVFLDNTSNDWNYAYMRILNANLVLDHLKRLPDSKKQGFEYDNVLGSALFYRAYNFYQLAQTFAVPYNSETAHADLGIPLRLEADVNLKSSRATIEQTYNQIIDDLNLAQNLLPISPIIKYRPSKGAAFGLLSKVYLQMENYEMAGNYANEYLKRNEYLIDYNLLDSTLSFPFPRDNGTSNNEIIFMSFAPIVSIVNYQNTNVDTVLLNLYSENDLRKTIFFKTNQDGHKYFVGSYYGFNASFTGFSTSEFLLIRAESHVRQGRVEEGLADLNTLSKARYKINKFKEFTELNNNKLLQEILNERRRELAFRGTRWEDLRRLNKDPRFAITINRKVNGKIYSLEPNSKKYTWPIPPDVIRITNIEQNQR